MNTFLTSILDWHQHHAYNLHISLDLPSEDLLELGMGPDDQFALLQSRARRAIATFTSEDDDADFAAIALILAGPNELAGESDGLTRELLRRMVAQKQLGLQFVFLDTPKEDVLPFLIALVKDVLDTDLDPLLQGLLSVLEGHAVLGLPENFQRDERRISEQLRAKVQAKGCWRSATLLAALRAFSGTYPMPNSAQAIELVDALKTIAEGQEIAARDFLRKLFGGATYNELVSAVVATRHHDLLVEFHCQASPAASRELRDAMVDAGISLTFVGYQ
jgi:hypothetical protein